jgi:TolA-binding protein
MNSFPRLLAITTLAILFSVCERIAAQTTAPLTDSPAVNAAHTPGLASTARSAPRRIVPLRLTDTPEGARVTIASDAALDDYTSRLDGDNFYILIPHSQASRSRGQLTGRGFTNAQIEQRDDQVLLSFRLQIGASVRVSKGFNRLDVVFKTTELPPQPESSSFAVTPQPSGTPETTTISKPADGSNDEREIISQMRSQIAALESRIHEIETRQAEGNSQQQPAQAAPANATVAASSTGAAAGQPSDMSDHDEMSSGTPRLQIQGFADMNFRASDQKGKTNAFVLGQLDLFLTSRLSEKFSVLGELIVEAGADNEFSFEIHRLLLRYAHNDYFNFSAGRFHSAIGYYNTAYHHGSWFQTAANRPFIFAFESKGGILPLHNVGLSITGRIPSAPLGLRYVAEIGNGRASRSPLDRTVQTAVDENNGKAFNLGIFARPKSLPGFQTGFSIYRDNLTPNGSPKIGQTIMAAHFIYQNKLYEMLNEAVVVRHTLNERVFHTPGFYTQFSRRFGDARPYFRYQYVNAPSDDPIFPDVGRRNGPSLGLRYDVSDFAAFKAQYDRTQRRSLSSINELILQLAFTF